MSVAHATVTASFVELCSCRVVCYYHGVLFASLFFMWASGLIVNTNLSSGINHLTRDWEWEFNLNGSVVLFRWNPIFQLFMGNTFGCINVYHGLVFLNLLWWGSSRWLVGLIHTCTTCSRHNISQSTGPNISLAGYEQHSVGEAFLIIAASMRKTSHETSHALDSCFDFH